MIDLQNQFISLWQECYDASYYALRTKKVWGFLHDTATLEKEIHRQVWDERFGNALISHPASRFLDELQADHLETAIHIRSRMRSFRPRIGVNTSLFKGLLAGEGVLILLWIVLSFVHLLNPLKWLVTLGLVLLLLAGAALIVWMLTKSMRAPAEMKKSFDEEKNTILKLLEAAR